MFVCLVCTFVSLCHISRVPDQNGMSQLYDMLWIHHSGSEPLICGQHKKGQAFVGQPASVCTSVCSSACLYFCPAVCMYVGLCVCMFCLCIDVSSARIACERSSCLWSAILCLPVCMSVYMVCGVSSWVTSVCKSVCVSVTLVKTTWEESAYLNSAFLGLFLCLFVSVLCLLRVKTVKERSGHLRSAIFCCLYVCSSVCLCIYFYVYLCVCLSVHL